VALPQTGSSSTNSRWNLEKWVFVEGGKPENPEKNPRNKDENQQQTQLTYDIGAGNRSGPHWWEESSLTTAPSPLPSMATNSKEVLENDS